MLIPLFFITSMLSAAQVTPEKLPEPAPQTKNAEKQTTKPTTAIPSKTVHGKQEIAINGSLPLTGEVSILGNQIFDGMTLFFNKMKEAKLPFSCNLKVLDDGDVITKMEDNVTAMLKDSPILISPLGTDTLSALIDRVKNNTTLVLFPLDGASALRKPEYKNLLFFRPSFAQEIKALIDYTVKTLRKKKIAIFYEASEWGEGVLKDTEAALAEHKLTLAGSGSYPQRSLNITQGAEELVKKAPNVILCIAGARPAYNFIRHMINRGLSQTVFLGLASLASIQSTLNKSRGVKIITSSVVPDPVNSKLPLAVEYRADMKKYFSNKQLTPFSFEGYINAMLLVECLKLTQFPKVDVTVESIIQTIESLKHVKFKGLELKFDPTKRSLSNNVWINTGDEKTEWFLASNKTSNPIKEQVKA